MANAIQFLLLIKDNLCFIVCHEHVGLQLKHLEVGFDCVHYQKTAFFKFENWRLKLTFCKKCFIIVCKN